MNLFLYEMVDNVGENFDLGLAILHLEEARNDFVVKLREHIADHLSFHEVYRFEQSEWDVEPNAMLDVGLPNVRILLHANLRVLHYRFRIVYVVCQHQFLY